MDRRDFIQKSLLASVAAAAGSASLAKAQGFVPVHNWDGYNFGSGPAITDRLNQGPFPTYKPE